jgi:exodeoxyribonuclease VII small subunit
MLVEVEGICREIAAPDLDLDHMISKVERGYQLIQSMRTRLDATREKIDQLRVEMEAAEKPDGPTTK